MGKGSAAGKGGVLVVDCSRRFECWRRSEGVSVQAGQVGDRLILSKHALGTFVGTRLGGDIHGAVRSTWDRLPLQISIEMEKGSCLSGPCKR